MKPRITWNPNFKLWQCLENGYLIFGPTPKLAYDTWCWVQIIPPEVGDWLQEWERRRSDPGATQP